MEQSGNKHQSRDRAETLMQFQRAESSMRDLSLLSKCWAFLCTDHCAGILRPLTCSKTCASTFIHKLVRLNTSETAFKTLTLPKLLCGHVSVISRPTSMKSKHIICAKWFCGLPASFAGCCIIQLFPAGPTVDGLLAVLSYEKGGAFQKKGSFHKLNSES